MNFLFVVLLFPAAIKSSGDGKFVASVLIQIVRDFYVKRSESSDFINSGKKSQFLSDVVNELAKENEIKTRIIRFDANPTLFTKNSSAVLLFESISDYLNFQSSTPRRFIFVHLSTGFTKENQLLVPAEQSEHIPSLLLHENILYRVKMF